MSNPLNSLDFSEVFLKGMFLGQPNIIDKQTRNNNNDNNRSENNPNSTQATNLNSPENTTARRRTIRRSQSPASNNSPALTLRTAGVEGELGGFTIVSSLFARFQDCLCIGLSVVASSTQPEMKRRILAQEFQSVMWSSFPRNSIFCEYYQSYITSLVQVSGLTKNMYQKIVMMVLSWLPGFNNKSEFSFDKFFESVLSRTRQSTYHEKELREACQTIAELATLDLLVALFCAKPPRELDTQTFTILVQNCFHALKLNHQLKNLPWERLRTDILDQWASLLSLISPYFLSGIVADLTKVVNHQPTSASGDEIINLIKATGKLNLSGDKNVIETYLDHILQVLDHKKFNNRVKMFQLEALESSLGTLQVNSEKIANLLSQISNKAKRSKDEWEPLFIKLQVRVILAQPNKKTFEEEIDNMLLKKLLREKIAKKRPPLLLECIWRILVCGRVVHPYWLPDELRTFLSTTQPVGSSSKKSEKSSLRPPLISNPFDFQPRSKTVLKRLEAITTALFPKKGTTKLSDSFEILAEILAAMAKYNPSTVLDTILPGLLNDKANHYYPVIATRALKLVIDNHTALGLKEEVLPELKKKLAISVTRIFQYFAENIAISSFLNSKTAYIPSFNFKFTHSLKELLIPEDTQPAQDEQTAVYCSKLVLETVVSWNAGVLNLRYDKGRRRLERKQSVGGKRDEGFLEAFRSISTLFPLAPRLVGPEDARPWFETLARLVVFEDEEVAGVAVHLLQQTAQQFPAHRAGVVAALLKLSASEAFESESANLLTALLVLQSILQLILNACACGGCSGSAAAAAPPPPALIAQLRAAEVHMLVHLCNAESRIRGVSFRILRVCAALLPHSLPAVARVIAAAEPQLLHKVRTQYLLLSVGGIEKDLKKFASVMENPVNFSLMELADADQHVLWALSLAEIGRLCTDEEPLFATLVAVRQMLHKPLAAMQLPLDQTADDARTYSSLSATLQMVLLLSIAGVPARHAVETFKSYLHPQSGSVSSTGPAAASVTVSGSTSATVPAFMSSGSASALQGTGTTSGLAASISGVSPPTTPTSSASNLASSITGSTPPISTNTAPNSTALSNSSNTPNSVNSNASNNLNSTTNTLLNLTAPTLAASTSPQSGSFFFFGSNGTAPPNTGSSGNSAVGNTTAGNLGVASGSSGISGVSSGGSASPSAPTNITARGHSVAARIYNTFAQSRPLHQTHQHGGANGPAASLSVTGPVPSTNLSGSLSGSISTSGTMPTTNIHHTNTNNNNSASHHNTSHGSGHVNSGANSKRQTMPEMHLHHSLHHSAPHNKEEPLAALELLRSGDTTEMLRSEEGIHFSIAGYFNADSERGWWHALLSEVEWVRNAVVLGCAVVYWSAIPTLLTSLSKFYANVRGKTRSRLRVEISRVVRHFSAEANFPLVAHHPAAHGFYVQFLNEFDAVFGSKAIVPNVLNESYYVDNAIAIRNFCLALIPLLPGTGTGALRAPAAHAWTFGLSWAPKDRQKILTCLLQWSGTGESAQYRLNSEKTEMHRFLKTISTKNQPEEKKKQMMRVVQQVRFSTYLAAEALLAIGTQPENPGAFFNWIIDVERKLNERSVRLLKHALSWDLPSFFPFLIEKIYKYPLDSSQEALGSNLCLHALYDQFVPFGFAHTEEKNLFPTTGAPHHIDQFLTAPLLSSEDTSPLTPADIKFCEFVHENGVLLNLNHPLLSLRSRSFDVLLRLSPSIFGLDQNPQEKQIARTHRHQLERFRIFFTSAFSITCSEQLRPLSTLISKHCLILTEKLFKETFSRYLHLSNDGRDWTLDYMTPWTAHIHLEKGNLNPSLAWTDMTATSFFATSFSIFTSEYGFNESMRSFWSCLADSNNNLPTLIPMLLQKGLSNRSMATRAHRLIFSLWRSNPRGTLACLSRSLTYDHGAPLLLKDLRAPKEDDSANSKKEQRRINSEMRETIVSLLADLVISDFDSIRPSLHILLNYSILRIDSSESHGVTRLLDSIVNAFRNSNDILGEDLEQKLDTISRCIFHGIFRISYKEDAANFCKGTYSVQHFVGIMAQCLGKLEPQAVTLWGQEALKWGTRYKDLYFSIRGYDIYSGILKPFDKDLFQRLLLQLCETMDKVEEALLSSTKKRTDSQKEKHKLVIEEGKGTLMRTKVIHILLVLKKLCAMLPDETSKVDLFWTITSFMHSTQPAFFPLYQIALDFLEELKRQRFFETWPTDRTVEAFLNVGTEWKFKGLHPLLFQGLIMPKTETQCAQFLAYSLRTAGARSSLQPTPSSTGSSPSNQASSSSASAVMAVTNPAASGFSLAVIGATLWVAGNVGAAGSPQRVAAPPSLAPVVGDLLHFCAGRSTEFGRLRAALAAVQENSDSNKCAGLSVQLVQALAADTFAALPKWPLEVTDPVKSLLAQGHVHFSEPVFLLCTEWLRRAHSEQFFGFVLEALRPVIRIASFKAGRSAAASMLLKDVVSWCPEGGDYSALRMQPVVHLRYSTLTLRRVLVAAAERETGPNGPETPRSNEFHKSVFKVTNSDRARRRTPTSSAALAPHDSSAQKNSESSHKKESQSSHKKKSSLAKEGGLTKESGIANEGGKAKESSSAKESGQKRESSLRKENNLKNDSKEHDEDSFSDNEALDSVIINDDLSSTETEPSFCSHDSLTESDSESSLVEYSDTETSTPESEEEESDEAGHPEEHIDLSYLEEELKQVKPTAFPISATDTSPQTSFLSPVAFTQEDDKQDKDTKKDQSPEQKELHSPKKETSGHSESDFGKTRSFDIPLNPTKNQSTNANQHIKNNSSQNNNNPTTQNNDRASFGFGSTEDLLSIAQKLNLGFYH